MKKKVLFLCLMMMLNSLLLFAACNEQTAATTTQPAVQQPSVQVPDESVTDSAVTESAQCPPTPAASATAAAQSSDSGFYPWIVYWDFDTAISESRSLSSAMGNISVFAAYFRDDDSIIFPQSSQDTLKAVRDAYGTTVQTYLTFVNDIKYENGGSSLKDVDLLRRLLSNQTRMTAHIDEIIALAKEKGADGIEIDYENIKGDDALWQLYAQFLCALNDRAVSEGLRLRVVLETSALGKATFPAGPQYTVMVYNLYGNHSSEPGPKADEAFITETAAKSVCLGPDVCFAFATGGFDWSSSGNVDQLCETAAAELAQTMQTVPSRDQSSGALTFTYQNDQTHTVWYADGQTICIWLDAAKNAGIRNFALWRLGGNSEASLKQISEYLTDNN